MQPLTVPASLGSLEPIRRYLALAATEARLDEKSAYRLRLAVDEVVTNIIMHGYAGKEEKGSLRVQAEADDERITVQVEDSGHSYDLRLTPPPPDLTAPLERRAPGGLGVFLTLKSTDAYHYERVGDRNRSTLVVTRNGGARTEPGSYERERQIARDIQAGFLPSTLPAPPGWQIAAAFEPAQDVAGDFYDAFALSSGRRVALVIADVCGKGIGAALFMTLVRSLLRAFARQHYSLDLLDALTGDSPVETLRARDASGARGRFQAPAAGATALRKAISLANEYILENHGEQDMYATVFFGVLDPANGSLMYINAGHNPPFIRAVSGVCSALAPTGPAIGILPDASYSIGEAKLSTGELLLAYTDGVTEARGPEGAFFGEARLRELVVRADGSVHELLHEIQDSLRQHQGGGAPSDDVTMLAVRRT